MFGIFSLEIFTGTTETFQIFAAHGLPLQTSEKERRKMELINNLVDYSTRYPVHLKCQSLECQWWNEQQSNCKEQASYVNLVLMQKKKNKLTSANQTERYKIQSCEKNCSNVVWKPRLSKVNYIFYRRLKKSMYHHERESMQQRKESQWRQTKLQRIKQRPIFIFILISRGRTVGGRSVRFR